MPRNSSEKPINLNNSWKIFKKAIIVFNVEVANYFCFTEEIAECTHWYFKKFRN